MSSLRRGHANLLCIVPILTDDPRRESRKSHSSLLHSQCLAEAHTHCERADPCTVKHALCCCWAEALLKIARMTLTIKRDGNWSSFQLANSALPLSVTSSAIAPSARMGSTQARRRASSCHFASRCSARCVKRAGVQPAGSDTAMALCLWPIRVV